VGQWTKAHCRRA